MTSPAASSAHSSGTLDEGRFPAGSTLAGRYRILGLIGRHTHHPIDVRLVAATNRNLTQTIGDKLFRSDLYYRLKVFPIITLPLRDHAEDIPVLARHFTRRYAAKMDRQIDKIPTETMKALVSWPWRGNVRELENLVERSVILSRGPSLRAPLAELRADTPAAGGSQALDEAERAHILRISRDDL